MSVLNEGLKSSEVHWTDVGGPLEDRLVVILRRANLANPNVYACRRDEYLVRVPDEVFVSVGRANAERLKRLLAELSRQFSQIHAYILRYAASSGFPSIVMPRRASGPCGFFASSFSRDAAAGLA